MDFSALDFAAPGGIAPIQHAYFPQSPTTPQIQYPPDVLHQSSELFLQIPDNKVGYVIGKGGACLTHISESSGAKINVTQKNEFMPGTTNRVIAIKGSVPQIHQAHILLLQRIQHSALLEGANSGSPKSQHAAPQSQPLFHLPPQGYIGIQQPPNMSQLPAIPNAHQAQQTAEQRQSQLFYYQQIQNAMQGGNLAQPWG
eukprot:Selendium_serpulae@DN3536_c0_g1_i1.p1